jgi:hypothetical protein
MIVFPSFYWVMNRRLGRQYWNEASTILDFFIILRMVTGHCGLKPKLNGAQHYKFLLESGRFL